MKKEIKTILSIILLLLGLILIEPKVTGAVIGVTSQSSVIGIFLILISGILFVTREDIEERMRKRKKFRKTDFKYTGHVCKAYLKKRGWDEGLVKRTIAEANKLELSRQIDLPHRPAIVYFMNEKPNQYVVRDLKGNLLQVSNLKDPYWEANKWESDFVYLGKYLERMRSRTHKHGKKRKR